MKPIISSREKTYIFMGQNVDGLYFNYMDPLKPDQSLVYF